MSSGNSNRTYPWVLWAGVTVVLVAIVTLAWNVRDGGGQHSSQDSRGTTTATSREDAVAKRLKKLPRREAGDPLAMGRKDAPVVMIKYEDFRCPFCSKFTTDVEPRLINRYVDTGVLRIEWRDFPIFGDQSVAMAKAARAAARQGKFWKFHDVAYAMGSGTKKASFPEERIQQVAKKAGVPDLAKFNVDRKDPAIVQAIQADVAEGQELGVSSTPAFVVGGQTVLGAQPLEEFVAVIEEERKNA